MKKIENVKEFVEKIDATKKVNPKDLSSDQDLTIALMNLISIEEHLIFSGAKTGKTSFYDLVEQVREMRKTLMQKVIPLLASAMRLMEVGTKQQSLGHKEEAYRLFDQAYELYCLFWGLNMNMINVDEVKWVEDKAEDIKKISAKLEAVSGSGAAVSSDAKAAPAEKAADKPQTAMGRMKAFVRKAVDCCIE